MLHPLHIPQIPFLPGSIDQLDQTLESLAVTGETRDINGTLISIKTPLQKYKLTLKGKGKYAPCLDTVHVGYVVDVHLAHPLWQHAKTLSIVLGKKPVSGSITAVTPKGVPVKIATTEGCTLTFDMLPHEGVFVSYRPLLRMQVTDLSCHTRQTDMGYDWTLILEEV